MKQKAVLAFSGGLDTSVVIKYLQEKHRMDVITVTVDVGEGSDQKKIAAKAENLGVLRHYNIDAKKNSWRILFIHQLRQMRSTKKNTV